MPSVTRISALSALALGLLAAPTAAQNAPERSRSRRSCRSPPPWAAKRLAGPRTATASSWAARTCASSPARAARSANCRSPRGAAVTSSRRPSRAGRRTDAGSPTSRTAAAPPRSGSGPSRKARPLRLTGKRRAAHQGLLLVAGRAPDRVRRQPPRAVRRVDGGSPVRGGPPADRRTRTGGLSRLEPQFAVGPVRPARRRLDGPHHRGGPGRRRRRAGHRARRGLLRLRGGGHLRLSPGLPGRRHGRLPVLPLRLDQLLEACPVRAENRRPLASAEADQTEGAWSPEWRRIRFTSRTTAAPTSSGSRPRAAVSRKSSRRPSPESSGPPSGLRTAAASPTPSRRRPAPETCSSMTSRPGSRPD